MSRLGVAITWLGHAAFHLAPEGGGPEFLIDPWIGNPRAPTNALRLAASAKLVLITHAHHDHTDGVIELIRRTGAVALGDYEVALEFAANGVPEAQAVGFNIGGSVTRLGVTVTLTAAQHSSSFRRPDGKPGGGGSACGLIITLPNGTVIYNTGDTGVFGDMALIAELYRPSILMLPIGDFYTMGPLQAAKTCELVQPRWIIPQHYGTGPAMTGTPDALRDLLPPTLRDRVLSPPLAKPSNSIMASIALLGVPLDLGASRRGVEMGPSAVRLAQLAARLAELGHTVMDTGDVTVPTRETLGAQHGLDFLPIITQVCRDTATRTAELVRAGHIPLVLGGDHSLAAGSVAGVSTALHERGQRLGLIWIDAHADINTPDTTLTGNVHGMPVAHLIGRGDPTMASLSSRRPAVRAEDTVIIGARDVDQAERANARAFGVAIYTMRDIDERGLRGVLTEAIERVGASTDGFHVSLDLDFVDPREAPGVGTPVRGGATYREAHLAMETLWDTGRVVAVDLVEVNPVLDEVNHTAELAVGLMASAFGKRIL